MNCLHCGSMTRKLSFREFWAELWKADACSLLILLLFSLFAVLPLLVAMWFFTYRCDQCGGTNWNLFGRWQKYFPPK